MMIYDELDDLRAVHDHLQDLVNGLQHRPHPARADAEGEENANPPENTRPTALPGCAKSKLLIPGPSPRE
jgi:hypothetical protein